jgi:hypothetical protein
MARKKAKRDPLKAPIREFLGNSLEAIAAGEAADQAAERRSNDAAIERALEDIRVRSWPINKLDAQTSSEDLVRTFQAAVHAAKSPAAELWDLARGWWPVRLLRDASNDPERYKRILYYLLLRLDSPPPDGVLSFKGKRGRDIEETTVKIYETWIDIGKPSLTKIALAKAHFGREYTTANPEDRKKKIDLCRQAVTRMETRLNSTAIESGKR